MTDPDNSSSEVEATNLPWQVEAGNLSTIMGSLQSNVMQRPGGSNMFITRRIADVSPPICLASEKCMSKLPSIL